MPWRQQASHPPRETHGPKWKRTFSDLFRYGPVHSFVYGCQDIAMKKSLAKAPSKDAAAAAEVHIHVGVQARQPDVNNASPVQSTAVG